MKQICIFSLVLLSRFAFSQTSFELFNSKSEFFFNKPVLDLELEGLKPDSVKTNAGDSIYYHYRILAPSASGNCYLSAQTPSWLGKKTLRRTNGDYVFYNGQNDSLLIKSKAPLSSSWTYYTFSNGDYIKATVTSIQYEPTFDGQSDTVKTISFQAYNTTNAAISHAYNGQNFKIAKFQGVIKLGTMYYFPNNVDIQTRCFGKRFTNGDLLDVNVGDTLVSHYHGQNNSGYYKYDLTRIFLSKSSPSLNTVVYTVSVTQQSENGSVQSTTTSPGFTMITTYSTSTNTQTITLNNTHLYPYPQMPGQFINNTSPPSSPSGYKMRFYFNPVTGNKYCNFRFVAPSTCVEAAGVSDTCLGPSVSCNTNQYTTNYYKLDGYTEQLPTPQNQTTATHAPTYYSSSAVKCGTLNLMSVRDNMSNYNFSIFPNPCSDYLIIESNGGYKIREVRITDLMGRKALGSYTATVSRIDVSTLQKGIYFITLVTEKGEAVRKFAKD